MKVSGLFETGREGNGVHGFGFKGTIRAAEVVVSAWVDVRSLVFPRLYKP